MLETLKNQKAANIEISGLNKSFGDQPVLHDINLSIKPGETFVIMGPSGSGKSVLLKHIIGLEKADSGSVLIDGLPASDPKTHHKIITSIVFQAGALFQSMSVYDNLAFYPREHRLFSKNDLHDKVSETLKMLSLENAAQKFPSELSGGMRKRVSIARALMMEPQLLLYDEPTSELDPIMAATISEIIATLKERFEVTSIVVSHDRDLALNIADNVAIIFDGKIETIVPPKELSQTPNPRVQEFLNPKIDTSHPRFKKTPKHHESIL